MNRNIQTRLQRLESRWQDHALGDSVVAFYKDGGIRAERNGEPHDGSLEGHRIVSRVNFVTPRPVEDD